MRQRQELEAVLSSMVEGVLAFDPEANLISLNAAAGRLLGVNPEQVRGRSIEEAVRNPELQEFVALTLSQAGVQEREISFFDDAGERFIQAHGTGLADPAGTRIGALVVLNDVTSIRRLERMRRDFVANASHEIRTPVTSLKGFIETLQEGAIDDPEAARRFLAIMKKNADRLHAIIEDLLNLSRIEREAERGEVPLEDGRAARHRRGGARGLGRHPPGQGDPRRAGLRARPAGARQPLAAGPGAREPHRQRRQVQRGREPR